jgi:hypothetical protein
LRVTTLQARERDRIDTPTACVLVATRIWLVYGYQDVARSFDSHSVYLLTLRNGLLLVLLATLVLATAEAAARSAKYVYPPPT